MASELRGSDKEKVLFLCYHNSARSQMAEGFLRSMYGDEYEAYSGGIKATRVDPRAIEVMREAGIDISSQHSKDTGELVGTLFDLAVTVCDEAKEDCPICRIGLPASTATAPAARRVVHKTFKDPALAEGSREDQLQVFRQVRDEIRDWISQSFGQGIKLT